MDKLLKRYKLSKLIQEERENLNKPIVSKETESVTFLNPTKKNPGPGDFTDESTKLLNNTKSSQILSET